MSEAMPINDSTCPFRVGDQVEKITGDYRFDGEVRAVFEKRSGQVRLVVEDDRGILHIYNPTQLRHAQERKNEALEIVRQLLDQIESGDIDVNTLSHKVRALHSMIDKIKGAN